MKLQEFDKLVPKTRLKGKSIEIARRVLVDNEGVRAVAVAVGLTHQRVSAIAQTIVKQKGKKLVSKY